MTPYERFHSRSLYLLELAVSLRPEGGIAESFLGPGRDEDYLWLVPTTRHSFTHAQLISDNISPPPIQTPVATALLALFLTFRLCPQPRQWPRPMLRKVRTGRRSDWGININNAGFEKGTQTWMAYCRTMVATRFSSAAARSTSSWCRTKSASRRGWSAS